MARRKSSKRLVYGIVDPSTLASEVISNYVNRAQNPDIRRAWTNDYERGIVEYLKPENAKRRDSARERIEKWYEVFRDVVYPRLGEIYAQGKVELKRRTQRGVAPATAVATP